MNRTQDQEPAARNESGSWKARVGDDGRDGGGRRWWVGRCGGWMDGLVGR